MIVGYQELAGYRRTVAMVDGAFDPLHHGHIEYFTRARAVGGALLCNITVDAYTANKHKVLLPAPQRAQVIDALKPIDYTHVSPVDTETVLRQLQPTHYIKGKDWEGRLPPAQIEICREYGIEIVYLDTVRDSSTRLLERFEAGAPPADLNAFEELVFSQRAFPAEHYVDEYWDASWRAGDNVYTLAARRPIEGRQPQLIKDVFAPARVLDVGCGPGILMTFLDEVGVVADGVDPAPGMRDKAERPDIGARITYGGADTPDIPSNAYDLVVCREVFEHLTVLQVREAVRNICRISSRFVYVTTRFHPNPQTLLDVNQKDELDPSHITLMNKDLLRLMFVLEGFRRRVDLEQQIDWMNKGRALVYEKQHA
jgi:cytidyltransferase-like protein